MDTTARKQKTPSISKLHKSMIAVISLLSVFIIVSLCVTITILVRNQPRQPREMVLMHPNGRIVPAGVTPQGLQETMRLSKEWATEFITGDHQSGQEKLDEAGQLILSGQIVKLQSNTSCLLLETKGKIRKVRLTEGRRNGETYWVPRKCVVPVTSGENIPVGFCIGAFYLRYLITAAICGMGICFLKLKSVFMQIMLFIIGMLVLNLIWVRIEMLLFL